jgi:16S rRNA (guanine966-N2)-methyltransferase
MLRIIAGQWRGRPIKAPKDARTRPTLGRVREAIFSMLGEAVEDARVLDLFAGAGSLGFEALSRGARSCLFIDTDRRAVDMIRSNARQLGCDKSARMRRGTLPASLRSARAGDNAAGDRFDIVLIDPPYEGDLIAPVLDALAGHGWLAPGAIVAVETRQGETFEVPAGFELLRDRRYGDTQVRLFRGQE